MMFYQLEYTTKDTNPITGQETLTKSVQWFTSEREAVVERLSMFKLGILNGRKSDHKIWPVDVPTKKADLLVWLRKNAVHQSEVDAA